MAKRQSNKQTSKAADLTDMHQLSSTAEINPLDAVRRDATNLMATLDTLAAAAINSQAVGAWTLKSAAVNMHAVKNALTSYATLTQN